MKQSIKDATDLTDVENVKGNETYKRGKKDNIMLLECQCKRYIFTIKEQVIKNLPVSMKVTYYLMEKKFHQRNLLGKSGKVKIRYEYENHSAVTKNDQWKTDNSLYTIYNDHSSDLKYR